MCFINILNRFIIIELYKNIQMIDIYFSESLLTGCLITNIQSFYVKYWLCFIVPICSNFLEANNIFNNIIWYDNINKYINR